MTRQLRNRLAILLLIAPVRLASGSDEIPGADQQQPIALVGATIHTVSGPTIERGTLVFDAGRITALGRSVKPPEGAKRIDVSGLHVYPGLFNACGNIGLAEISAVRATNDYSESGRINSNVKAEVAVNPDSELIPVTRSGGMLLSLSAPSGGLISGTSAVLELDGWTWEQMTVKAPAGMHVEWPSMNSPTGKDAEKESDSQKTIRLLDETMAEAEAYRKARAAGTVGGNRQPLDARLEALVPVLSGELPLIVTADEIRQIEAAVAFAQRWGVKLILLGGYDAPLVASLLREHQVPVIIGGVHRLPRRRGDDYDAAYTLPDRLRRSGIEYCISTGSSRVWNSRNLPFHAATAVAYGLSREEALKAITLYPARIFGLADRVGSLEVGKDATLIVTDGDPLETPTEVLTAFIEGRPVDLSNRQKRLWKKYEEKYRQLGLGR